MRCTEKPPRGQLRRSEAKARRPKAAFTLFLFQQKKKPCRRRGPKEACPETRSPYLMKPLKSPRKPARKTTPKGQIRLPRKPKLVGLRMDTSVRAYLASIGKKGGQANTPAKAAAARLNGLKGGRPRKSPLSGRQSARKAVSLSLPSPAPKTRRKVVSAPAEIRPASKGASEAQADLLAGLTVPKARQLLERAQVALRRGLPPDQRAHASRTAAQLRKWLADRR